ncbi:hypothetical protein [Subtercola lobariae]|uniref:Thioester domain-containing protein n=1 Tax=Subtercola lobariae TaxID=1588641 RepID=A0A917B3U1_9MICO|nr:hypothetical protein [Subtercola lobariae]GGF19870.1 hypothetical protein GCM10011399_11870 [Subtercola lobariae]
MKRLVNLCIAALATLGVMAAVLFAAPAALALAVVEHAYGHLSETDGRWLGSHRLEDGNLGLCLQLTKAPPEGSNITYVPGAGLNWYSTDDSARLAYLGRQWLLTHDANEASAAQLAAWTITGLNGHDDAFYAQRANGDAAAVLARARAMRTEIDGPNGASRSVTATVAFADIAGNGGAGATVQSDLFVDFLAGGVTRLPAGLHPGFITLTGATFDDGSVERVVTNGESLAVHPTAGTPTSHVTAKAEFGGLPYGNGFWAAEAPSTVQTLLVPQPALAVASATASADVNTDAPFSPAVATLTSSQTASPGAAIHDSLDLSLATPPTDQPKVAAEQPMVAAEQSTGASSPEIAVGDTSSPWPASDDTSQPLAASPALDPLGASPATDSLGGWGTYTSADGQTLPIPVTIRSTLLGPFASQPTPAAQAPDGSDVVCRVETVADAGPGSYSTPDCVVTAAGFYVWTETIDPADTPLEKGGARVKPWASPFGTATEVTLVTAPPPPPPSTTPPTPTAPPTESTPPPAPPVVTPTRTAVALPHDLASTGAEGVPWWVVWAIGALIAAGIATRLVSKHERFHRRRR